MATLQMCCGEPRTTLVRSRHWSIFVWATHLLIRAVRASFRLRWSREKLSRPKFTRKRDYEYLSRTGLQVSVLEICIIAFVSLETILTLYFTNGTRYAKPGNCSMGRFRTVQGKVDWETAMMQDDSPCEPACPPEGCFNWLLFWCVNIRRIVLVSCNSCDFLRTL